MNAISTRTLHSPQGKGSDQQVKFHTTPTVSAILLFAALAATVRQLLSQAHAKHFPMLPRVLLTTCSVTRAPSLCPFYKWGEGSTNKLGDTFKVPQSAAARKESGPRRSHPRARALNLKGRPALCTQSFQASPRREKHLWLYVLALDSKNQLTTKRQHDALEKEKKLQLLILSISM